MERIISFSKNKNMIFGYLLTLMVSWMVWCVVDIGNYWNLSSEVLWRTIVVDFLENAAEAMILYLFAAVVCEYLKKFLWKRRYDNIMIILGIAILAILNAVPALILSIVYLKLAPFERNIFYHILISDYVVVTMFSTVYLVTYLISMYRKEELFKIQVESESRKKEIITLQTQLDLASVQVNNHFVFNCFSTLSGLIKHNPEVAEEFIRDLSLMYRYLVKDGARHYVPLGEELEFMDHYVKLVKYRYSGICISISSDLHSMNAFVPPLSIQTLIENAIKHNSHGPKRLLQIEVKKEEDRVVVSNNIIKREDDLYGTCSGLSNLNKRYHLMTGKELLINNDGKTFSVAIPLLFDEDICYESIDN